MTMTCKWRIAARAILFVGLAVAAVLAHLEEAFAWQILGSILGLGALALVLGPVVRAYPFISDTLTVRGRSWDLETLARRLLPGLLVVGVAIAVLGPLLAGQMPLSHDHPVHLYKAWHFWDEMLLAGRLRGWSSYWFFGYPAEELYPIGPDMWVAAFRLATLGLLSWEATYGLAFVGVFAFAAYAIYSFGRRHLGTWAGVVAGLLWVLDMGDYREGGWAYTVDWAVWVQIMAMGFLLLALSGLMRLLQRPTLLQHAVCGLLFGAALLSHQMNVMLLGLGLPLLLLSRWGTGDRSLGREVAHTTAALALAGLLAGFWLIPMLARSGWTTNIGDPWRAFSATVDGMMDGTVFANNWPLVVLLGVVGAALALAMRHAVGVFLLLLAAVLLLLSSSTALQDLSLVAISKSFSKIQYQRLVIPAKACLFLLAGFALSQLAARVAAWRREREAAASAVSGPVDPLAPDPPLPPGNHPLPAPDPPLSPGNDPLPAADEDGPCSVAGEGEGEESPPAPPAMAGPPPTSPPARPASSWRRVVLLGCVCVILAPFVRPAAIRMRRSYLRTIGSLELSKNVWYWNDYQAFLRWSARRRETSKDFYRISYELDRHNHLMMGAPAFNRTPYYKVGYTPAKLFKHVTETTEDEIYNALSVAYVVSLGPLSRPGLEEETRLGSIWVYRYKKYRPQRYTLSGPGRVEVLEFGEERIRLRISGTAPESRLKVHVANYPRWRARLNGQTVPIAEAPVYGTSSPMLMEVRAADGELVFEYVMRGADWLGALSTLLGLALLGLMPLTGRKEALSARLGARLAPTGRLVVRHAGTAAVLALVLSCVLVAWRVSRRTTSDTDESSLARLLPGAEVTMGGQACDQRKRTAWGMGWFCSERGWNYVGDSAAHFNGGYIPCIWAHPLQDAPLVIRFHQLPLGKAIAGHHGLADEAVDGFPGGSPVTLEVAVNGKVLERLVRPNEKGWQGFSIQTTQHAGKAAELVLTISTDRSAGRHYCFEARILR